MVVIRSYFVYDFIECMRWLFRIKQAIINDIQPDGNDEMCAYQIADLLLFEEMQKYLNNFEKDLQREDPEYEETREDT